MRYAIEIKAAKEGGFVVAREQALAAGQTRVDRKADGDAGNRKLRNYRAWFDRKGREFRSSRKELEPEIDPQGLVLPMLSGSPGFRGLSSAISGVRAYSIEPSRLRDLHEPDAGTQLRRDGSNVASVLKEIAGRSPDDLQRIRELLSAVVPCTKSVSPFSRGNRLGLEFTQSWNADKSLKFEALNMSDGTLRVLGLLTAVYQKRKPTLIVVEEPEATLHPEALGALSDILQHGARSSHILVTTHSPDLLDTGVIQEPNLRLVQWEEGQTTVRSLADSSKQALRSHLMGAGEMFRSNALSPTLNKSPKPKLFADL